MDVWQMTEMFQAEREMLWSKTASTATAAAATATLRSQTSTSPAKNKEPVSFFPPYKSKCHNPEVSGRQMIEVWLYKFRKKLLIY